jgi:hypothetical protein
MQNNFRKQHTFAFLCHAHKMLAYGWRGVRSHAQLARVHVEERQVSELGKELNVRGHFVSVT